MRSLILLIISFFFYSCKTSLHNRYTADSALYGSWKLVADQLIDNSGNVIRQDTNVAGLIVYTPEKKMSAQFLWRGTRSKIMTDSIMNNDGISSGLGAGQNTWSLEQARTIIDTYDAYFGDYTVDAEKNIITHIVDGSLRPEKNGTLHKRSFRINEDTLYLRSADTAMKWQTKWTRIKMTK
jgi:hypothetical protein